jgi:3-deoxy-D-manno-octulosonic-acid transferase
MTSPARQVLPPDRDPGVVRRIYTLAHYALVPLILLRLAWRGLRNRGYWWHWGERFGLVPARAERGEAVWIHAVSVGEVQAAVPIVRALRGRHAELGVVLTTTTPTGRQRALEALGDVAHVTYVPYDLPGCVSRFLLRTRPRLLVIMETELWPNIVKACAERAIPVLLANARLSERSARGYARFTSLAREMLAALDAVAAQSRDDADRLLQLGARASRVRVTGSVKFDMRLPASLSERGESLRRRLGVDRAVWIAASTHDREEALVLDAYAALRARIPNCLLLLVPRHPERFTPVMAACRRRGFSVTSRTTEPESCEGIEVYVGDTMGELPLFYAASDVAFVGGSLVPVGGHNPLEPAALGLPVVFGPYVFNFAEITERLRAAGAAWQVPDASRLASVVTRLLEDGNVRHQAGERGRQFVEDNRGAVDAVVHMMEASLL